MVVWRLHYPVSNQDAAGTKEMEIILSLSL